MEADTHGVQQSGSDKDSNVSSTSVSGPQVDSSVTANTAVESNEADTSTAEKVDDSKVEKEDAESTKQEAKKIPVELEKYWQTVRENPSDFTGWTYLLQFVEQENDIQYAREAFDAFFEYYPYCYGYWKKYADLEKKNKNLNHCEEVYERGVKSIMLSVELWIHYINFSTSYHAKDEDVVERTRRLYERAIQAVGKDFRSDKLWDKYIDWEMNQKEFRNVTKIYDTLLSLPTQLYSHHYDNFQSFVNSHHPKEILELDDFLALHKEVVAAEPDVGAGGDEIEDAPPGEEAPPGVEDVPPGMEDTAVLGDKNAAKGADDKEIKQMREKIIALRASVHKTSEEEVSKRWTFEEGIRRPYFHVKPLEKGQIKNWKEYLDFEIEQGDNERIILLFERCMIACALYEDFWIKYVSYMEEKDPKCVSSIYKRACNIHLPKKTYIHLHWAAYEEGVGNVDQARTILTNIEKQCPGLVMLTMRKISFERRQGNMSTVGELFQNYIDTASDKQTIIYYSLKFARYSAKVTGDHDKAKDILTAAIGKYPDNTKLYLQLVDLELNRPKMDESKVLEVFDMATSSDLSVESKILFSQRKMEFLEDFGSNMSEVMKGYDLHQKFVKDVANEDAKKRKLSETTSSDQGTSDAKKSKSTNGSVSSTSVSSSYSQDPNAAYNYGQWANYNSAAYAAYNHQWYGPHSYSTTSQ